MGIQMKIIQNGDGNTYPKDGQKVTIHYEGKLQNGKVFDSSRDRSKSFCFTLGRGEVIKGFDEGIKKMSMGQRSQIVCSPDYGYGPKGYPGVIPPNSVLTFDVELLSME